MSELARNIEHRQEYWRPAVDESRSRTLGLHAESCERCGTDFALGARFCHVCGHERVAEMGGMKRTRRPLWDRLRFLELEQIKSGLGLPLASVIAFFIGMVCVVAAAMTGMVYSASTLLDWQAVQIWRVEWLLAAMTAFVAGLLLKK